MLPSIQFNFLICSYLPGLPLALAVYFVSIRSPLLVAFEVDYWVSYVVIAPLFFGLFLDAIRHGVASALSRVLHIFWEPITPVKLKKFKTQYGESGSAFLLDKLSILYYVFEFFFNLFLSLVATLFVLCVWKKDLEVEWVVGIILIALLSLLCAWVMKTLQQKLIGDYAK
ncbi:MAG: hypothetical protein KAU41_04560 [Deltaproteobacteria bacterium]|nr:hypothetical protein [Deltaproteobacteria bacterium]